MKIQLIKYLLLLLATAVLLSSCGDDDEGNGGGNPVVNNTPYLPGTNGSIWVYSNQSIGSDGTVTNIPAQDTLTITNDSTTVLGRTAKEVSHNFVYPFGEGVQNTTNYAIAQDGSKLSVSSNFMTLLIPELLQNWIRITPDIWLLMTNGNAGVGSSWTIDSTNFTNFVVEGFPVPVTLTSGDTKLQISRQKDTTVDNKPCHHYKLSIFYLGGISSTDQTVAAFLALINARAKVAFAEVSFFWSPELGLQKLAAPAQDVKIKAAETSTISILNEGITIPGLPTLPGFTKTLVYNKING